MSDNVILLNILEINIKNSQLIIIYMKPVLTFKHYCFELGQFCSPAETSSPFWVVSYCLNI